MALNQETILFKNLIGGVAATNEAYPYWNEQAGASKQPVTLSQMWLLSKFIPATNPLASSGTYAYLENSSSEVLSTGGTEPTSPQIPVLEKVTTTLYKIQGTNSYGETVGDVTNAPSKSLANKTFKDVLSPFIWGSTYAPVFRKTSDNAIINIYDANNDGFFDFNSGVVSFYGASIYAEASIEVEAYIYSGPTGATSGVDLYNAAIGAISGGGGGLGEWQDSVLGYLNPVKDASDISAIDTDVTKYFISATYSLPYTNTYNNVDNYEWGRVSYYNGTFSWTVYDPINADRFINTGNGYSIYVTISNPNNLEPSPYTFGETTDGSSTSNSTVATNDIIEFWDKTVRETTYSGWVITTPSTGFFSTNDSDNSQIIRFDGEQWVDVASDITIPTTSNKFMDVQDTTADGDIACTTQIAESPYGTSYVEVNVNGVAVDVGNTKLSGATTEITAPNFHTIFVKQTATINAGSSNTTTITFNSAHGIVGTNNLIVQTATSVFYYNNAQVTVASSTQVTLSGLALDGVPTACYIKRSFSTIDAGDIALWFGSYAGFQLENGSDTMSFNFVKTTQG